MSSHLVIEVIDKIYVTCADTIARLENGPPRIAADVLTVDCSAIGRLEILHDQPTALHAEPDMLSCDTTN
jgi:hypothetical protein